MRAANQLEAEMAALQQSIAERRKLVAGARQKWTRAEEERGEDKQALRFAQQLQASEREYAEYTAYLTHLHALLDFNPSRTHPVARLTADDAGIIHSDPQPWRAGLPLHLFEDPQLHLPAGSDRTAWLSDWHTEREWLSAIPLCRYSDGVIGIVEELSPVGGNLPGAPGMSPILLRYERHRRELVQPDFHVFAADHWNFNARNFNPGGNHGGFFRISTHSVWMMAGAGVSKQVIIDPYDSLNFASTILNLLGRTPPMPDRVVPLQ